MSKESEDLRDVAHQIEELARSHKAYSMIHKIVDVMCDHIYAIARTIECREDPG